MKEETENTVPEKQDIAPESDKGDAVTTETTPLKSQNQKKGKKKLFHIISVTAGIMILLFVLLSVVLGLIIKTTVNNVMPMITGTPVSMGSCYLNPITGTLSIKDFTIGNPEGYATPNAFKLNEVYVDLAVTSLLSDKIIIEDILVDDMEVCFETKMTETNVGRIMDNINKLTAKDEEVEKTQSPENQPEDTEVNEETTETPAEQSSKGIEIDHFKFVNSKLIIHAGGGVDVPLPNIEINDLGKDSEKGADAVEITDKVFTALYHSIIEAAEKSGMENVKKGTGQAVESIKEGAGAVVDGVKNLFGGNDDDK